MQTPPSTRLQQGHGPGAHKGNTRERDQAQQQQVGLQIQLQPDPARQCANRILTGVTIIGQPRPIADNKVTLHGGQGLHVAQAIHQLHKLLRGVTQHRHAGTMADIG